MPTSGTALERPRPKPFYDLEGFARLYLKTHAVDSHEDVRTEQLTETFRHHLKLPPFPTIEQLMELCSDLEIELEDLPSGSDELPGANISYGLQNAIYLQPDLPTRRAETTLCHELREVIERALKRAAPWYRELDSSNNKEMHSESEHFAGCLLMQAAATDARLKETGYDLVRFAAEQGRSLPSVIMRAQKLYSSTSELGGPFAGIWLFEAPWGQVRNSTVTLESLVLRYRAHLRGFSMQKNGSATARLANMMFPAKGTPANEFPAATDAVTSCSPVSYQVPGFDLFDEHNYFVFAEPIFVGEAPWRVLATAVRKDCLPMVRPWIGRLGESVESMAGLR